MKLTQRQQSVLDVLTDKCRHNATLQRCKCDHLHQRDLEKLATGDQASVFGMGALTFQIGHDLGIPAGSVLATLKVLEARGLVIRETAAPNYKRPLYWWPVGLAAKLTQELGVTEVAP